ncbi:MAG TPA: hypothetical protein VJS69_04100 [Candidatus Krumholzibacteria bacterium]|nr:hypothetical protein [Candidatus Krumholzibacteria bacterium]
MTRTNVIRPLAAALAWASVTTSALRSRAVLWPWMTQSVKLFIGTLMYNAFALIVVQPLLKKWFPPLKPWEHVTGALSGHSRTTYEQIVPLVATTLWIMGNALLFALMNRNLRRTQETIAAGGVMTRLEPRPGR